MDPNMRLVQDRRVARTLAGLERNRMEGEYLESRDQVVPRIRELLSDGDTVAVGGSATLSECGVLDHLRSGRYRFLDRYAPGLSPEQVREIHVRAFSADAYLCSTNAVTEQGELYNVDGNSNRVAAILFGPRRVILVAGVNKIVRDVDEAILRVKQAAAPANCMRLGCPTYCREEGRCLSLAVGRHGSTPGSGGSRSRLGSPGSLVDGCASEARICCNYVVCGFQRHPGRIRVLLVGESLGF